MREKGQILGGRPAWLRRIVLGGAAVALGIQLVPYGWSHPNPPVTADPPWPSVEVRQLAVAACYACHSNQTDWPVYSYVAPMSWLVRRDVEVGREELNFSTWDRDANEADDAAETINEATMPPLRYLLLHPEARLSPRDRQRLAQTLAALDEDRRGRRGRG